MCVCVCLVKLKKMKLMMKTGPPACQLGLSDSPAGDFAAFHPCVVRSRQFRIVR